MLLLVCAVLLAAVVVTRPWEETELTAAEVGATATPAIPTRENLVQAPPGDGRTVSIGDSNVLLRYPEGFGLAADEAQLDEATASGACRDGFDYCVYPESSPSTVRSSGLRVSTRPDLGSEAACVLDPNPEFADRLPKVGGGGDHATAAFGEVRENSDDGVISVALHRLYFRGHCFELQTRVVSADDEASEAAGEGLSAIVERVALPDGRSNLWSSGP